MVSAEPVFECGRFTWLIEHGLTRAGCKPTLPNDFGLEIRRQASRGMLNCGADCPYDERGSGEAISLRCRVFHQSAVATAAAVRGRARAGAATRVCGRRPRRTATGCSATGTSARRTLAAGGTRRSRLDWLGANRRVGGEAGMFEYVDPLLEQTLDVLQQTMFVDADQ